MVTKEGLIQSKRQFRINVQMISSIDKMHLQRVEMGDDGDKGRTDKRDNLGKMFK